ncbi:MAG: helix-turn-helix transcriptional regulator [Proteobacteria bacterium]|nr:helix-turn-helix transcriptional regulator [Pseudomonadota bacterium]
MIKKINQLVESKLAEDINLKDLADIACMSKNHFLRAFRNTVGQTPYNYVLTMRIERARGLLLQKPQLAIAEVARQTGFKNLSHFSTTFRRIVAVTPSAYRARLC